MDLEPMPPEMDELRKVIISSNLASCYLILEVLKSEKSEALTFEGFRNHWIDVYKSTYGMVSKMKPRKYRDKEFSEMVKVEDRKAKEKFFDAISYFSQWISGGLLNQKEIESFNQNLAKFWELVEVELEENAEVLFNLYEMLKKTRNWDDETLHKELRISEKAIEDIKRRRRPTSKKVGLKMLYELFPQMAV